MNIQDALNAMTPEIYERFKTAIEIGRWPNGEKLSQQQKSTCLQAVIIYEQKYKAPHERTAYVPPKSSECNTEASEESDTEPLNWQK